MQRRRSANSDGGSVFDKIAECRERVENDAESSPAAVQEAQDVEDRIPERQENEEHARDDAHSWRD
jgi:hypothetical protein